MSDNVYLIQYRVTIKTVYYTCLSNSIEIPLEDFSFDSIDDREDVEDEEGEEQSSQNHGCYPI